MPDAVHANAFAVACILLGRTIATTVMTALAVVRFFLGRTTTTTIFSLAGFLSCTTGQRLVLLLLQSNVSVYPSIDLILSVLPSPI
jgi:hypothetical protein